MRTQPAPGSDPQPGTRDAAAVGAAPADADLDAASSAPPSSADDDRLRRDVPPHW